MKFFRLLNESKIEVHNLLILLFIKVLSSEKATKFCEISIVDLSYVVSVKSTVEISRNFVAFSEYMNFNNYIAKIFSLYVFIQQM